MGADLVIKENMVVTVRSRVRKKGLLCHRKCDKVMTKYAGNDVVIFESCLGERLNPYIYEVNIYNIHCCF